MSAMGGEYQRVRYENKKADGFCTRCAERRVSGRTLCPRHLQLMNEQSAARRAARKAGAR